MATKIRLQRGGRKSYAFYSIIIADARAPRDGKFTEKGLRILAPRTVIVKDEDGKPVTDENGEVKRVTYYRS